MIYKFIWLKLKRNLWGGRKEVMFYFLDCLYGIQYSWFSWKLMSFVGLEHSIGEHWVGALGPWSIERSFRYTSNVDKIYDMKKSISSWNEITISVCLKGGHVLYFWCVMSDVGLEPWLGEHGVDALRLWSIKHTVSVH